MHRPLAEWDPHASQSSDRGWRPHQEASQETQYATACCGRGASCPHLLLYCACVVRAGWPRWQETLLHVSDSLAHNKFVLLLLIICPVIYFDVIQLCAPCLLPIARPFAPDCPWRASSCFECYDFEAVAAHELGHVLGFGHSDEFFMDNLMRPEGTVMNNATCEFAALEMPAFVQDPGGTVSNRPTPELLAAQLPSSHTLGILCLPDGRYVKPNHRLHR